MAGDDNEARDGAREAARAAARDAPRAAAHAGAYGARFLVAFLLAPLPRAWREGAERRSDVNADDAAVPSGLAQLLVFALLFILGYLAWLHGLQAALDASARRAGVHGASEDVQMIGAAALWMSPIMPFIFMATTVQGFLSAIFALGGLVRICHAGVTKENMPDPTLALVDWLRRAATGKVRKDVRELSKGPASPDRMELDRGEGWALRIVSTADYAWTPGNAVFVAGEPHVLVSKTEVRDAAGRLRLRYDLRRLGSGELMRGMRHYQPAEPPQIIGAAEGATPIRARPAQPS